jgi:hypothetical protein
MSDSCYFSRFSESRLREAFNLYHANFWVIGPATAGHGRGGCSYVELVATSAQMQRPLWQLGSGRTLGRHFCVEKMGDQSRGMINKGTTATRPKPSPYTCRCSHVVMMELRYLGTDSKLIAF